MKHSAVLCDSADHTLLSQSGHWRGTGQEAGEEGTRSGCLQPGDFLSTFRSLEHCLPLQPLNAVCSAPNTCQPSFATGPTRDTPPRVQCLPFKGHIQVAGQNLPSSEIGFSYDGPSSNCLTFKIPPTALRSLSPTGCDCFLQLQIAFYPFRHLVNSLNS